VRQDNINYDRPFKNYIIVTEEKDGESINITFLLIGTSYVSAFVVSIKMILNTKLGKYASRGH
jgi:hypothetical protein